MHSLFRQWTMMRRRHILSRSQLSEETFCESYPDSFQRPLRLSLVFFSSIFSLFEYRVGNCVLSMNLHDHYAQSCSIPRDQILNIANLHHELHSGVTVDAESIDMSALAVVRTGCALFTELLHKHAWHDCSDFYDAKLTEQRTTIGRLKSSTNVSESSSSVIVRNALGAVHRSILARRATLR